MFSPPAFLIMSSKTDVLEKVETNLLHLSNEKRFVSRFERFDSDKQTIFTLHDIHVQI